ncbi:hypothetical protein ABPG72_015343 [Tetrahymena utriculariae]
MQRKLFDFWRNQIKLKQNKEDKILAQIQERKRNEMEEEGNDDKVNKILVMGQQQLADQQINEGSVDSKQIKTVIFTTQKEFLELGELTKTWKLYVEGNNINEFVSFLQKSTKTIVLQPVRQEEVIAINSSFIQGDGNSNSGQQQQQQLIRRGVIRFKNSVPTQTIQKVLENSSLSLRILVSKSSSKDDNSFFSSSSQQSSSLSSSQSHLSDGDEMMIFNNGATKNNNSNNTWQQQKDKLFNKLARLLIENPSWGFNGLVNYINTLVEIDERDSFFGVMSEKMNDLENAVRLGKMVSASLVQSENISATTTTTTASICQQQQQQQYYSGQQFSFIHSSEQNQPQMKQTQQQIQQQQQQQLTDQVAEYHNISTKANQQLTQKKQLPNKQAYIQIGDDGSENSKEVSNLPLTPIKKNIKANNNGSISPRPELAKQKSIENMKKGQYMKKQKSVNSLSNNHDNVLSKPSPISKKIFQNY